MQAIAIYFETIFTEPCLYLQWIGESAFLNLFGSGKFLKRMLLPSIASINSVNSEGEQESSFIIALKQTFNMLPEWISSSPIVVSPNLNDYEGTLNLLKVNFENKIIDKNESLTFHSLDDKYFDVSLTFHGALESE